MGNQQCCQKVSVPDIPGAAADGVKTVTEGGLAVAQGGLSVAHAAVDAVQDGADKVEDAIENAQDALAGMGRQDAPAEPASAAQTSAAQTSAAPTSAAQTCAAPTSAAQAPAAPAPAAQAEQDKEPDKKGAAPKKAASKPKQAAGKASYSFKVKIVSARDLMCGDIGSSDPFVKCTVGSYLRNTFSTKVIRESLNPIWNQCVEVSGVASTDVIAFEVYDKDWRSDDHLGKCELNLRDCLTGYSGELKLVNAGKKTSAVSSDGHLKIEITDVKSAAAAPGNLDIKMLDKPPVKADAPKVMVTVVGAKNLRNADFVGKSDPYVVCKIAGKPDSVFQTPMIKDNLNPHWDHTSQIANFEYGDCLNFSVFDDDLNGADLLGRAVLTYDQLMPKGFSGKLKLKESNHPSGVDSDLEVKITVVQRSG